MRRCQGRTWSSLRTPFDRQPVVAGKGLHPDLVVGCTLAQELLVDRRNADDLTEEMHHLLGPRQPAEVAANDHAVEAMVDERKQVSEQLGEQFPGHPHEAPVGREKPSSVDRASGSWKARVFVWPMRCAIFSAGQPTTTAASSRSVSWSCSPPKQVMPGCSTPPTSSPQGWLERGRTSRSTSRKPIPPSPLVGRAAIASKARHSSTRITTPAVSPRSSGTRSTNSARPLDREISNMFG